MNDRILSLLGLCRRAGKLVIGADPATDSIRKGKARLVIYANDFSQKSLRPVLMTAHSTDTKILGINRTKEEISLSVGKLCGVAAIEDKGFADKLITLINGEQGGE